MDDWPANLERLYREIGPAVWAFIRRRISNAATAEELFQETFLAAAKKPSGLEAALSKRAWLLGIARNLVREHARRRTPHLTGTMEEMVEHDSRDPDDSVEEMRQAIQRLPEAQREVLEFRLTQELTYEEIAAAVGVPIGTVRSRLHAAVAGLRAWARDAALRQGDQ